MIIITTATVSAEVVKEMLIEAIEKEMGLKVINLSFNISQDYGPHDRPTGSSSLKNVTVEFSK